MDIFFNIIMAIAALVAIVDIAYIIKTKKKTTDSACDISNNEVKSNSDLPTPTPVTANVAQTKIEPTIGIRYSK